MSVKLDHIAPWGRSFDEYRLMFQLSDDDLRGHTLGCGDGPASFNGEATARGYQVISVDPLYSLGGDEIRRRFELSVEPIMSQVRAKLENYVWSYHSSPDVLLACRREALNRFLADYEASRRSGRYVVGALPQLPFEDSSFDLVVCSHFLFLYSAMLDLHFHMKSVQEMCRVCLEVRIFPLTTLECETSAHLRPLREHLRQEGMAVDEIRVPYQLQRNGDRMLRVRRAE